MKIQITVENFQSLFLVKDKMKNESCWYFVINKSNY